MGGLSQLLIVSSIFPINIKKQIMVNQMHFIDKKDTEIVCTYTIFLLV